MYCFKSGTCNVYITSFKSYMFQVSHMFKCNVTCFKILQIYAQPGGYIIVQRKNLTLGVKAWVSWKTQTKFLTVMSTLHIWHVSSLRNLVNITYMTCYNVQIYHCNVTSAITFMLHNPTKHAFYTLHPLSKPPRAKPASDILNLQPYIRTQLHRNRYSRIFITFGLFLPAQRR